jgi:hypothetical protein
MKLSEKAFNDRMVEFFGTDDFSGIVMAYEVNGEFMVAFCDKLRPVARRYPMQCWFKAGDSKAHRLYDLVVDAQNIWSVDTRSGSDSHFWDNDYEVE